MNVIEAREAIEEILASIPDSDLPELDRVEYADTDDHPCVWWGDQGHYLGTAKRNGKRDPLIYRRSGSWDAIHGEMLHRADRRLLDNGDDPTGVQLAKKAVRS